MVGLKVLWKFGTRCFNDLSMLRSWYICLEFGGFLSLEIWEILIDVTHEDLSVIYGGLLVKIGVYICWNFYLDGQLSWANFHLYLPWICGLFVHLCWIYFRKFDATWLYVCWLDYVEKFVRKWSGDADCLIGKSKVTKVEKMA